MNSLTFMKVTRIFTDNKGNSRFEDIEIKLYNSGNIGFLSEKIKATGMIIRETPEDYDYDWHNAPQRQYIVMLDGEVEIEISDGTKRIFRTGDIILVEDTEGQGHKSKAVKGKPRKSLFITLD